LFIIVVFNEKIKKETPYQLITTNRAQREKDKYVSAAVMHKRQR
jgi:hypothetical protein